jgi:hypothetical protein
VGGGTLTAISRPVTRGIRSALRGMGMAQGDAISLQELSAAIDSLSTLPLADLVVLTQLPANFAPYLVSDMLLVEGVLRAMGLTSLSLAEAAINNLPALLRDERAFEWAKRHRASPCASRAPRLISPTRRTVSNPHGLDLAPLARMLLFQAALALFLPAPDGAVRGWLPRWRAEKS